ncbi:MAG: alginate export family protein, partial [Betaproteobacteria bacterium]|nr:alginate export family protein [Betaproteobacteria bacterium]
MTIRTSAAFCAFAMATGVGDVPVVLAADADPPSASSLNEALTGGKLTFNLRPRYEHVEQDGKTDNADAFTNRTLLGWRTLPYQGFSLYAEAINVARIGDQNYNDTPLASAVYPTVADPENTDVNQLYLDYTGLPQTKIRVGRMSLKLDNVRYIGNVEFRQVMQVFNG